MANVINEIKNWCLFTEKFGEEYQMHDAVIKRFDLKRSWGQIPGYGACFRYNTPGTP